MNLRRLCVGSATSACGRKEGSHIRFTTAVNGTHHITVPNLRPIKTGTLHGILKSIAAHHKLTVEELIRKVGL